MKYFQASSAVLCTCFFADKQSCRMRQNCIFISVVMTERYRNNTFPVQLLKNADRNAEMQKHRNADKIIAIGGLESLHFQD